MIKEALQYLVSLGLPTTVGVKGRTYTTKALEPITEPTPDTIGVTTLSALVGYIGADCDNMLHDGFAEKLTAHVVSPTRVNLYAPADGDFRVRPTLLRSEPLLREIPFGRYISGEEMVVLLQTCFVRNEGDWAKVVAVAGNVSDGATREYTDDGVSQAVTARVGVATKADVAMPNPVMLAPFRTFPEIEQPLSSFVFRARSGGADSKPTFALFEADGGAWRIEAMDRIADWLEETAKLTLDAPESGEDSVPLHVIY